MSAQPAVNEAIYLAHLDEEASETAFILGLMIEHLEEAAFLYEQRRDVLLDDAELSWSDLYDFEERLEAHIDGLYLGGGLALAVCRQRAADGDVGEMHVALRVFCRRVRKDLVDEVLDQLDPDDPVQVLAAGDALRDDLPAGWESYVVEMLEQGDPWLQRIAAHVIGYRRIAASDALIATLERSGADLMPVLIWALGRLRATQARQRLHGSYLNHEVEAVREATATALLRLGEQAVLRNLLTRERGQPWALRALGNCGSRAERRFLLDVGRDAGSRGQALIALGVLGDPDAVDALLYHLEEPDDAEAAALGLYLITGADLVEDVFEPEEFDDEELFDDELEKVRSGEKLTRPDGEIVGTTRMRLSQDPEAWRAWWTGHAGAFETGTRYRTGRLYSPDVLFENLSSERCPHLVRRFAVDELVIRYGIDVPFEPDSPVVRQKQGLTKIAAELASKAPSFREGHWYFAGRQLARQP